MCLPIPYFSCSVRNTAQSRKEKLRPGEPFLGETLGANWRGAGQQLENNTQETS